MRFDVFMGALAGLKGFIISIIMFFFSGYFEFVTQLKSIQLTYRVDPAKDNIKPKKNDVFDGDGLLDFTKMNRMFYFFKKKSWLKTIYDCFNPPDKIH